jgi:hypothetical protein
LTRKEREELVLDLYFNQNKTYHQIAKIARMSPRDIKPIIDKAYQEKERMENQELLMLDTISPIWAKKLEESKLLPVLSLKRLRLYLELKDTSKCVVGEAYGFSSSYVYDCKRCSKIAWKFMFYFMIHLYSKLEETKKGFVTHWGEKHHHYQLYPTADRR